MVFMFVKNSFSQGYIWFVQVHAARHKNVSPMLHKMIKRALREGKMVPRNLFLLYLSWRQEISASLAGRHGLPRDNAECKPFSRLWQNLWIYLHARKTHAG